MNLDMTEQKMTELVRAKAKALKRKQNRFQFYGMEMTVKTASQIIDHMRKSAQRDAWRYNGRMFGYPECCIENFCTRGYSLTKEQKIIADMGHGFVPCEKHAKHVVKEGVALESLIHNRDKSLAQFPNSHEI